VKLDSEYLNERRDMLRELQSEPLSMKVQLTIAKVLEFYQNMKGKCYLSCSGGADSVVLYHIIQDIKKLTPDFEIPVVFDDTGLEEPSVRATALAIPNIKVVKPKMSFYEVLTKIGYPVISKETAECVKNARRYFDNLGRERERERERERVGFAQNTTAITRNSLASENIPQRVQKILGILPKTTWRINQLFGGFPDKSNFNKDKYRCLINAPFRISSECCNIMKKQPMKKVEGYPIIATMTEESKLREQSWLKNGCNSFEGKISSKPMSFWKKQDVLQYIKEKNVKIADCYGEVIAVDSKGNPTFDEMADHYAFSGVQRSGCIFCLFGIRQDTQKGGVNRFEHLRQTQPQLFDYCMRGGKFDEQGLWIPDKGLGLAFVIEWLNRNLSKKLKNGKTSLYIKGVDLSNYKKEIDSAFEKLAEIEGTRKKWCDDELIKGEIKCGNKEK